MLYAQPYPPKEKAMSEELKPCSCGSTDTSIGYESPQGYWVECGDCGRQTEKSHGRDLAIAAWSRRAQPAEAEGVEVVAYATPDEYGGWQMLFFDEKEAMLYVEKNEQPSALVLHSALSAVTAERDRLQKKWARVESERDQLRAELETVKKVAYGNLELLDENAKLRAEVEALRALLGKSLPVVEAHAGASHMLDGFRPARNKWDDLVDGIRAAMAAKEA